MSELKAYQVICTDDIDRNEITENFSAPDFLAYDAGEADKVIAEKDAAIAELKEQVHDYAQGLYVLQARAEKEARHSKYKRCLAMAEMCKARYDEEDAKVNGCGASWEYISKEMKYWERWRWRWEALAEEPTWAKFLQLINKEEK